MLCLAQRVARAARAQATHEQVARCARFAQAAATAAQTYDSYLLSEIAGPCRASIIILQTSGTITQCLDQRFH